MHKHLTHIVQLQWTTTTGKLWKMERDYQKDKSVIELEVVCYKNKTRDYLLLSILLNLEMPYSTIRPVALAGYWPLRAKGLIVFVSPN